MGISCDLEAASMESETQPTCNKQIVKLNGQDACSELEAKTTKMAHATSTPSDVIGVIEKKSTDTVINLVSPPPQETETIVIDDAEPEEGEIINTDSEFEYEAISSDEEFTLRQQIEALEAKNRELEKIASISARAIDYDYVDGYLRPPIYNNYKPLTVGNRSNITKTNPPLSSVTNYKAISLSHVENISSDEAQLVDSENELPFDSGKSYSRSHRTSKKEKRQSRRKTRTIDGEKERCLAHGKRRCTDISCYSIESNVPRKKRARHKYDERKPARGKYSSDSDEELLRNREELKMALNIIAPSNRAVNSSTLSHKLSAIQNQQALDDGKKSALKHRRRKSSRSPDRELAKRKRTRSAENTSKRPKNERDRSSRPKLTSPSVAIENNNIENEIQEDDDEAISLEEQELRLIALKSAVLKKHEARKKKQMATARACEQVIRPYSPTDSVVLVPDETGDRSNDCIDSDNNNMDISPISSPTNQYQPMDMELASSNENSKSPIFSYEKPQIFPPFDQFIDWGTVHIPVPISAAYVDIDQTTAALNQPFALQPPYSLVYDAIQKEPKSTENPIPTPTIQPNLSENELNDNEDELRARLIEQLHSTNTSSSNSATESINAKTVEAAEKNVPKENSANVDSLEEDCLRSLLLSSIVRKSNVLKETTNETQVPTAAAPPKPNKLSESIDNGNCDDMPKLTLNLREALKRLKTNQQNKMAAKSKNDSDINLKTESNKMENDKCEALQDCDHGEIQQIVVNNRVDKNENELCDTKKAAPMTVPSKETKATPIIIAAVPNESIEKEPTKELMIQKPVVDELMANPVKQQITSNEVKKIASEEKTPKSVPKVVPTNSIKPAQAGQTTKTIVNQKGTKLPAVSKSKMVPLRPKSSTPPIVSKASVTVTTASASTISTTSNLSKVETLRKSSASPVITTWTAKPVKKLIISLNEDSSSDNDDMQPSTVKKTDTETQSNTFQLRLDQFLQSVRANTNAIQETKQQVTVTAKTTVNAPNTPKAKVDKSINNSTKKIQVSTNAESSKAVAHLPMSSQLEYHRLLNRMKLLEKQKEQKSRLKTEQTLKTLPAKAETNFPNLTVVVQNENRIIQTKGSEAEDVTKPTDTNKISINKTSLSTSNTSLAKRVLVKNAMDSLIATQVTNESTQTLDANANASTVKASAVAQPSHLPSSVQCEHPSSNIIPAKETNKESKPSSISLEIFAKKAPKVRASLLANYIKRYRNQGEQYLNGLAKLHRLTARTNIETKKQQKLEQVLDELKRQQKVIEEKLAQQKTVTQSLFPTISTTEKTVATDRVLLQKLENCCNRLGHIVKGPDYKIQCEKEIEIKEKIRLITIEKTKLKFVTLKSNETTVKLPQPRKTEDTSNKVQSVPKPTLKPLDEKTVESKENLIDSVNSQTTQETKKDSIGIISVDEKVNNPEPVPITPKKMEVDTEPNPSLFSDEKCQNEMKRYIQNENKNENENENKIEKDEKNDNQPPEIIRQTEDNQSNLNTILVKATVNEIELADKSDDKPLPSDNLTGPSSTPCNSNDSETLCGKYDSPLVHMQNWIECKPTLSAADRNAIVCPYDLMGRCEDKQCEYKHLSM